jgi:hypothetical protein
METIIFKGPMGQTGGYVDSTTITDSNIDMNDKKITTLADPVNPQDAVNLRTMSTFLGSSFVLYNINLSGTSFSSFSDVTRGAYSISINGTVEGMPCATFHISKSSSSTFGLAQRTSSSFGSGTEERLSIRWFSNGFPELSKSGAGHDGLYIVKMY